MVGNYQPVWCSNHFSASTTSWHNILYSCDSNIPITNISMKIFKLLPPSLHSYGLLRYPTWKWNISFWLFSTTSQFFPRQFLMCSPFKTSQISLAIKSNHTIPSLIISPHLPFSFAVVFHVLLYDGLWNCEK